MCNFWGNAWLEDMKYFYCFLQCDASMSSFSITRKKTPFQKHREEEEAKKKVGLTCPS